VLDLLAGEKAATKVAELLAAIREAEKNILAAVSKS
jgi:hypothetical protein